MGQNRVFFPQQALDQWLGDNRVDLSGDQLVIKAEGRQYKIVEALHVLAEVSGGEDVNELAGKVKTLNFLTELGAEVLGSSMIIGDNAYDVVPGWLGSPVGTFAEHRLQVPSSDPRASLSGEAPKSEEELLAQYLMQALDR